MSGYTGDYNEERGMAEPGIDLLQKPFSAEMLVRRVREILDSDPDG